jgi:hypothetical protein
VVQDIQQVGGGVSQGIQQVARPKAVSQEIQQVARPKAVSQEIQQVGGGVSQGIQQVGGDFNPNFPKADPNTKYALKKARMRAAGLI